MNNPKNPDVPRRRKVPVLELLGSSPVSPHGQVTIPKKVRKRLDIKPKDEVGFWLDDGRVIIKKG